MWSAGTVLFEMVSGRPPFYGENHIDLLRNIQQKAVRLPPDLRVSKECVKLLRILLNRNPLSRANFKDFIEASNAFVALGCNGVEAPVDSVSPNQFANLTPISEEDSNSSSPIKITKNESIQEEHNLKLQYQNNSTQRVGRSESSQNSEESEFVMVERSATSASSSSTFRADDKDVARSTINTGIWKQQSNRLVSHRVSTTSISGINAPISPTSPRSNSSRFFSGRNILSSRNLIPPSLPFVNKGIGLLSTSPGTGGALVDLMGNVTQKGNNAISNTTTSSAHGRSSLTLPQNGVFNYELFARMLSAAEDVGRRAINVVHVGDTRAYLAMRSLMANTEMSCSSGIPMEGVVEEKDDNEDDENGSFFNQVPNNNDGIAAGSSILSKRVRAVSTDQSDGGEDEDDEMPFAIPTADDEPISTKSKDLNGKHQNSVTVISDANTFQYQTKTPVETIQMYFREAMTCYIKSLTMLKGSVHASQRILDELNSIGNMSAGNEMESMNQFKKRCETSHKWLGGQFKGVLERAEGAKGEISKLSSSNDCAPLSGDKNDIALGNKTNAIQTNVEELIYNHSLTCGKDGAVKQLLGQFEAARACYRSAGLLIETLLMEPNLVEEDKICLESYVQGFAERINELDHIMRHNSMTTSSSSSIRKSPLSSIVPLVSGSFSHSSRQM